VIRVAIKVVLACVLVVATLLLAQAFADRRFPDLESWQKRGPTGEFTAGDAREGYTFADYLRDEERLFSALDADMIDAGELDGRSPILRFVRGGRNNPATFEHNWNRSTALEPPGQAQPIGGVVLLHGLSDSPYSLRSVAEMFQRRGMYALCVRLPGHGTAPAALLDVAWEDWAAATRLAMRHVHQRIGADRPLYVCGYSNGGALAMNYALQALDNGDPMPQGVFLFSPAIAVTALARASNWHELYSWMPYFEKSKWLSIEPEYDPYKYCSFTKNAGAQVWQLTRVVQAELVRAAADGRFTRLPPIMTFQSAVDATIIADDVVRLLYDRLPANGSELIVFDVNRSAVLDGFYTRRSVTLEQLAQAAPSRYGVTLLRNAADNSMAVVAQHRRAHQAEFSEERLDDGWPASVYSLAHVAIPFPPDDPIYGEAISPAAPATGPVRLGDLSLRGEKHVLRIAAADMLRLRHNPIHPNMLPRIEATLPQADAASR
jgi:alpha-beta hydrolase superfamily lysophospholipase